jgi:hypothetical protein
MKLYATTTSERASKGQGGNEKLIIEIQAGSERKILARLHVEQFHGNVAIYSLIQGGIGGEKIAELIDTKCTCKKCAGGKIKGNKQKGECTCPSVDCVKHPIDFQD